MSDLKKSTVSEHLLKLSRQTGSTGEPYQQNVPRLKLPLVPYELGLVQGSIFENPEQISRVEAKPYTDGIRVGSICGKKRKITELRNRKPNAGWAMFLF